jgi:hypothetical protein
MVLWYFKLNHAFNYSQVIYIYIYIYMVYHYLGEGNCFGHDFKRGYMSKIIIYHICIFIFCNACDYYGLFEL